MKLLFALIFACLLTISWARSPTKSEPHQMFVSSDVADVGVNSDVEFPYKDASVGIGEAGTEREPRETYREYGRYRPHYPHYPQYPAYYPSGPIYPQYPQYPQYPPYNRPWGQTNIANQESTAVSGDEGVSIATGESTAGRVKRDVDPKEAVKVKEDHKFEHTKRAGRQYPYYDQWNQAYFPYAYDPYYGYGFYGGTNFDGRKKRELANVEVVKEDPSKLNVKVEHKERDKRYFPFYSTPYFSPFNANPYVYNGYAGFGYSPYFK